MTSALDRFCEKLREQELMRKKRKESNAVETQTEAVRSRKPKKRKPDKRLDNWQHYIKLRKKIIYRIMKHTGKNPTEILLNCSTITEKAMIQRLLDQADRLSPENEWRKERVKESFTKCGLNPSLPDNNAIRQAFTVYGLPEISKSENFCLCCKPKWFKSKFITQRFEEKKIDIYNLISHFPEVDGLQIVGKVMKIWNPDDPKAKQSKILETPRESRDSAKMDNNTEKENVNEQEKQKDREPGSEPKIRKSKKVFSQ